MGRPSKVPVAVAEDRGAGRRIERARLPRRAEGAPSGGPGRRRGWNRPAPSARSSPDAALASRSRSASRLAVWSRSPKSPAATGARGAGDGAAVTALLVAHRGGFVAPALCREERDGHRRRSGSSPRWRRSTRHRRPRTSASGEPSRSAVLTRRRRVSSSSGSTASRCAISGSRSSGRSSSAIALQTFWTWAGVPGPLWMEAVGRGVPRGARAHARCASAPCREARRARRRSRHSRGRTGRAAPPRPGTPRASGRARCRRRGGWPPRRRCSTRAATGSGPSGCAGTGRRRLRRSSSRAALVAIR